MKQSLYKNQIEYLKLECKNKPKLRTFLLFKDFDNTPSYLTQTQNFHNRRQFVMLGLGWLPLEIELGRHRIPKIPEKQRFCKLCGNKNLVESEYHLVFICESYDVERQNWLSKLTLPNNFLNSPQQIKLSVVLNDPKNVKLTSQYIVNVLNIRNRLQNWTMSCFYLTSCYIFFLLFFFIHDNYCSSYLLLIYNYVVPL